MGRKRTLELRLSQRFQCPNQDISRLAALAGARGFGAARGRENGARRFDRPVEVELLDDGHRIGEACAAEGGDSAGLDLPKQLPLGARQARPVDVADEGGRKEAVAKSDTDRARGRFERC